MSPVNAASADNDQVRADHLALLTSTKKLCEELTKNQKCRGSAFDNNWRNGENAEPANNTSLLERIEKLERIALNLGKWMEIQYSTIWGPEPAENGRTVVMESAPLMDKEETERNATNELNRPELVRRAPKLLKPLPFSFNRSEMTVEGTAKRILLKPVRDVKSISQDGSNSLAGIKESGAIDPSQLCDSNSQLNQGIRFVKPGLGKGNTSPTPSLTAVGNRKDTSCDQLIECLSAVFADPDPSNFEATSKHFMALAAQIRNLEDADVKKVAIKVSELGIPDSDSAILGARISQMLHEAIPSYRNQLIAHCQKEFENLLSSIKKDGEQTKHATKFLRFLSELYVQVGNKATDRIKIFAVAIVEMLKTLLGLEDLNLLKENLGCTRELLKLLKPTLIEDADPSLIKELKKLAEQCEKLKAGSSGLTFELKRLLLVANSTVLTTLNELEKNRKRCKF